MTPGDASPLLDRIGRRVRHLRQDRHWTARELADRAGISPRFLGDLEAGRANIAVGRLAQVASALEVPLEELVREEGPRAIALLGLRGAGKSTLGPLLAEDLGLPFQELNERIESLAGLPRHEIFALHGEEYFRRLERDCVRSLVASGVPVVVGLPGGVVYESEAFEMLLRHCTTVWLKASPNEHMRRVEAQGDRRPMAQRQNAMTELRTILSQRERAYRRANIHLDTSGRSVDESRRELLERLRAAGWRTP